MTGEKILKKLSTLSYILGILGIILGIIVMSTDLGDTSFQEYTKKVDVLKELNMDAKTYYGTELIVSSCFTLFEGWLLARAVKDGRKTKFLIILLVLGIISPILKIFNSGFDSVLNESAVSNIIGILFKGYILNQVLKVRKDALDE